MKATGPGRAVGERLKAAAPEAACAFEYGPEANPKSRGDDSRGLPVRDQPAGDPGSTMRGGAGIRMDVHSAQTEEIDVATRQCLRSAPSGQSVERPQLADALIEHGGDA